MDVDYLFQHTEAKDADRNARTAFIRQVGAAGSAAEHAVPEAMFRNPNLAANDPTQPQGVTAVKALAIAAAQGQKIYTLDRSNQSLHSTILQGLQISADAKSEIANALAVGKEVTVHEKDISVNGWTGNGYIVLDPDTGSGAYKIDGGANGGYLMVAVGLLLIIIGMLTAEIMVGFALPILGIAYIGCGLSMLSADAHYGNFAANLIAAILGGLLGAAGMGPGGGTAVGAIFAALTTWADFGDACAAAG